MELQARYRHRYNRLDEPLQEILKFLSIDRNEEKEINKGLHELLQKHLIPQMCERDPLFTKLFVKLQYMGSFYEGLRIKKPDEFDLNVELRLPKSCKPKVTSTNCPGFLKIKCDPSSDVDRIGKWISEDGFLIRDKMLYWMQGVVDKALQYIYLPHVKIRRSRSGPAVTLDITEYGKTYSVDLVPVFTFDRDEWRKLPVRQPKINELSALAWNAVPKGPLASGDTSKHWRMSFYNQEKKIMNNLVTMKPSIKLMKLLRDHQGWHQISSYFIKTVALWVNESNPNIWKCSLGVVFMEILTEFKKHLKDMKSIPFFWDKRHNLLSGLDDREIEKIGNRIAKIITKIDQTIKERPKELNGLLYSLFGYGGSNRNSHVEDPIDLSNDDTGNLTPSGSSTRNLALGFGTLAAVGLGIAAVGAILAFAPRSNRQNQS